MDDTFIIVELKEAKENLQRIRRNDPCGIYAIYRFDSKKGCYVRA